MGQTRPFAEIGGAVKVFDGVLDLDCFGQDHCVKLATLDGGHCILIAGVGVFFLEPVDRHVRLPVGLEGGAPAELGPVVVAFACQLFEHERHVASNQAMTEMKHLQGVIRRGEWLCIEPRKFSRIQGLVPTAGCEQGGQDIFQSTLEEHGLGWEHSDGCGTNGVSHVDPP